MYLKVFTALLKMHFNVYSDIHDGFWVKDALETNSNFLCLNLVHLDQNIKAHLNNVIE